MAEDEFTQEPAETDLPRYQLLAEEPGRRKESGKHQEPVLRPCRGCGALVVHGQTQEGTLAAVEPQTLTYTLAWDRGERWPRLIQSRGYPAHPCPVG